MGIVVVMKNNNKAVCSCQEQQQSSVWLPGEKKVPAAANGTAGFWLIGLLEASWSTYNLSGVLLGLAFPGQCLRMRVCCNIRADDFGDGQDRSTAFEDSKTSID